MKNLSSAIAIFLAGGILGALIIARVTEPVLCDLHKQRLRHEKTIDSLKTSGQKLDDTLKIKNNVTTIEIIKYKTLKPVTYSSPELDSIFRTRYH